MTLPTPSTINRRVKEYGSQLGAFLRDHLAGTEADTVGAEGTKCHSQDEDRAEQDVNITLEQDPADGATTVLDVSVNEPWAEVAGALDDTDILADDATVVSDAEEPLVAAFTDEDREHQMDLLHVPRTTSYKLWEDDAFPLADRKQIVSEVTTDLFHLKNSVEKHRPAGDQSAVQHRIDTTKTRVKRLAVSQSRLECASGSFN